MPLFTLECLDRPNSTALRAKTRPVHLDYLQQHAATVKLGGPWLTEDGQPLGSLLIVEAADIEAARSLAAADPYALAGLFESVRVTPWRLVVGGFAD